MPQHIPASLRPGAHATTHPSELYTWCRWPTLSKWLRGMVGIGICKSSAVSMLTNVKKPPNQPNGADLDGTKVGACARMSHRTNRSNAPLCKPNSPVGSFAFGKQCKNRVQPHMLVVAENPKAQIAPGQE